jgi:hypothetical protein
MENLQKPNEHTTSVVQKPQYSKFGILIVIFLCCTSLIFIILFSYYYVTLNNEIQSINNMATLQPINNITIPQTNIVSFTHNFTRLYNQTNLCDSSPLISLFPNNCINVNSTTWSLSVPFSLEASVMRFYQLSDCMGYSKNIIINTGCISQAAVVNVDNISVSSMKMCYNNSYCFG